MHLIDQSGGAAPDRCHFQPVGQAGGRGRGAFLATAALGALLALGACGGSKEATLRKIMDAATGKGGSAAEDPTGEKIHAYTDAYNDLSGTFGLQTIARTYGDAKIGTRSASDTIVVNTGYIEGGTTKLERARAKPAGLYDLDGAADALKPALDKVLARLKPLSEYYGSEAYRRDDLARGRAEDAQMKADFAAALVAFKKFDEALTARRKGYSVVELAALKKAGNMVTYNHKLALQNAEALVDHLNKSGGKYDDTVITQADAWVFAAERALEDEKSAIRKAKLLRKIKGAEARGYETAADFLTTMIGNYRNLRQSRSAADAELLRGNYNRAVSTANTIRGVY